MLSIMTSAYQGMGSQWTCAICRAACRVPAIVGLIYVEFCVFEVLWLPIQDVVMKIAAIVKADGFRRALESCVQDVKDGPAHNHIFSHKAVVV